MTILFYVKYTILYCIREKQFLFWMMLFPIILCSAFYLAFSNLDKESTLEIKFGINNDNAYVFLLENIPIFRLIDGDDEQLKEQLQNEKIDGYITSDYDLYVDDYQLKANIIVGVFENMKQYLTAFMIKDKEELNLNMSNDDIIEMNLKQLAPYTEKIYKAKSFRNFHFTKSQALVFKNQETSILTIILFSAFAMFSLYGTFIGSELVNLVQSYLSTMAARVAVSPYKKSNMVIAIFITSVTLSLTFNLILTLFVTFVLKIPLFHNLKLSIVIFVCASIFSSSLGVLFGTIRKIPSHKKSDIINMVILTLSFITGMSGNTDLRNAIEKNIPILNRLNFANVVNESLYQVNYIGDTTNLPRNLAILIGATIIILIAASIVLRRENYDSI